MNETANNTRAKVVAKNLDRPVLEHLRIYGNPRIIKLGCQYR